MAANLPLVLLTLVADSPPVSATPAVTLAKFAPGVVDTNGEFSTGIVVTGGKFATGVVDNGGAPSLANIREFSKKIKNDHIMLFSGAWGKMIHKKPEAKNFVTLSL
jgi:hypothetical protein